MTYQVGTSRGVRALHVMPGTEGPEGQLHAHDYRVEDRNLEEIRPPEAEAATVEVFARWVHGQLAEPVRVAGGERLTVRVFESDVAFGGFDAPVV